MELVFTGVANHAGTTPMALRHDALVAAAEWAVAVEKGGRETPGLVATVGGLKASPGSSNVIAGECRASLDVRHASDTTRMHSVEAFLQGAAEIVKRRGISLTFSTQLVQAATPMDSFLSHQIETAVSHAGVTPYRMVSGAGHDAMILAERLPSAMVFVRSPGGISHNPRESVLVEDVAKAIECGLHLLDQLAVSHEFQMRANSA
jgi:allantoate deiminase